MRVILCDDEQTLNERAADRLAAQLLLKPDSVLGLATGGTPVGTYEELIRRFMKGRLSFAKATTLNLDEYVGLSPDHPQSYHAFMRDKLFAKVDLDPARTHVPDGADPDPLRACRRYDRLCDSCGRIDLQLLGIGENGHIGFNEPAGSFPTGCHIVELKEETRRANARFFGDEKEVPRRAITVGIDRIMKARRIVLLANGPKKEWAIEAMLRGPVTPQVPASVLQLHPDCTILYARG